MTKLAESHLHKGYSIGTVPPYNTRKICWHSRHNCHSDRIDQTSDLKNKAKHSINYASRSLGLNVS